MEENKEKSLKEEVFTLLSKIEKEEPLAAKAILLAIRHIGGTYGDKYNKGKDVIDTKKMLYNEEYGGFLNIYQVNRYLQRYITKGCEKSFLLKDIEKAIHYLIFEITRRLKIEGEIKEFEPKI